MKPITAQTRLYCVLGSPVIHSKSPLIHNQAFGDNDIDAVYLAFEPTGIEAAVAAIRHMPIHGVSVTIPFKEQVMEYLDWIDDEARAIGAVNTIVNQDGKLLGYNTDSRAAIHPLVPFGITEKTVLVIGAGGAARAVAYGIHQRRGRMIVSNRSEEKGRALAEEYDARFVPMADIETLTPDFIINTSAMGMEADDSRLSCPESCLSPGCVVMDVVYTPLETRLVALARSRGCTAIDGLTMFVEQGAAQFELWTGIRPDPEKMRQAVLDSLA